VLIRSDCHLIFNRRFLLGQVEPLERTAMYAELSMFQDVTVLVVLFPQPLYSARVEPAVSQTGSSCKGYYLLDTIMVACPVKLEWLSEKWGLVSESMLSG
jgi:hypothetical protein